VIVPCFVVVGCLFVPGFTVALFLELFLLVGGRLEGWWMKSPVRKTILGLCSNGWCSCSCFSSFGSSLSFGGFVSFRDAKGPREEGQKNGRILFRHSANSGLVLKLRHFLKRNLPIDEDTSGFLGQECQFFMAKNLTNFLPRRLVVIVVACIVLGSVMGSDVTINLVWWWREHHAEIDIICGNGGIAFFIGSASPAVVIDGIRVQFVGVADPPVVPVDQQRHNPGLEALSFVQLNRADVGTCLDEIFGAFFQGDAHARCHLVDRLLGPYVFLFLRRRSCPTWMSIVSFLALLRQGAPLFPFTRVSNC
jgi:hypothetical protein